MKKTYIQPSMKAYTIKVNSILAGSVTANDTLGSQNQLSKGNSIWSFMDGEEEE